MEFLTLDKLPKRVLASIDLQRAFIASRLIVAAERLQIFRVLHGKRMRGEELGRKLVIHKAYRGAVLDSLAGLGLLQKTKGKYRNTRLAEKYFIEARSIYWTRQYSKECAEAYEALRKMEKTLATGRQSGELRARKKLTYTEAMAKDRRRAEDFTQMLFHFHQKDAQALARRLDLSKHRAVLDVGGGSGVMSIALAKKNPGLRACVLDLANVCRVARGNIRRAGLSGHIRTLAGDIRDRLPGGFDVVMFCDIGPVSKRLLGNAYEALPHGGMVVAVDRYLSEDRTKPLDRVMAQLAGSSFPRATRREMVGALESCGFRAVKARRVLRDLWAISGVKHVYSQTQSR
ncbi:MAG TPA: methyltransferase [Methylomirabilota bacterium]|nr:methyltransferase [Methylomirabilota bacterium]